MMISPNTSFLVSLKLNAAFACVNFQIFMIYPIAMDQTEGITCISVSASKKFLVICENAARAVWTVYEIQH